jgi:Flp pilus assembly protein TadG
MSCGVNREKGFVVIFATLSLIFILPLVGLAIDLSTLYMIRTRLSSASDAAALAAARSLSTSADVNAQVDSARSTARSFFDANFPAGFWGTKATIVTVDVAQSAERMRTVTVRASTDAPLYFFRILGHDNGHLIVDSAATRRDVNVMLILDRSGSLEQAGACDDVRENAVAFVNEFTPGRDQVGLLTFGGSYLLAYPPSANFASDSPAVVDIIQSIRCGGSTGTAQALWQGYQELVKLDQPGALNVIVFFTDGRPTALTADYPLKTLADVREDYKDKAGDKSPHEVSVPPTTCMDRASRSYPDPIWSPGFSKRGFMAGYIGSFDRYGPTAGLLPEVATGITDVDEQTPIHDSSHLYTDSRGCSFRPQVSQWGTPNAYSDFEKVRNDIAYIPDQDLYQNRTDTGYKPVLRFDAGPYRGQIRPDSPQSIRYAAYNAADDAARRIRANANLGVIVYAIGLGGTGSEPVDDIFLKRISNDPDSPVFNLNAPQGMYVYAPTPAQLKDAFKRVAHQILRLSM